MSHDLMMRESLVATSAAHDDGRCSPPSRLAVADSKKPVKARATAGALHRQRTMTPTMTRRRGASRSSRCKPSRGCSMPLRGSPWTPEPTMRISTCRSRAPPRARAPACRDWVALALQICPDMDEALTHYLKVRGVLEVCVNMCTRA